MGSLLFRLRGVAGISKSLRFWNCRREIMTSASRISSPWLMLPPSDDDGDKVNMNFYSLAHNKVGSIKGGSGVAVDDVTKLVGSSHGWLALLHERSLELFLWNPVSRRRINLPPIQSLPIPESDLKYGSECVRKVIVSDAGGGEGEWRVVMSFGMESEQRLAFCCPGRRAEWTCIGAWYYDDDGVKTPRVYEDFAYSTKQNRLFCITQFGDVERWDLEDPRSPKIDGSNAAEQGETVPYDVANMERSYVVVAQHSNEVFIVERKIMIRKGGVGPVAASCFYYDNQLAGYYPSFYPYKTVDFDVYKLVDDHVYNLRTPSTSSLNGLVMFLGMNHSFALPAAEFPELQTDSIYFTDDLELLVGPPCSYGGHDLGIYDFQNDRFSSCYYPNPNHVRPITRITPSPFWFTPTCH